MTDSSTELRFDAETETALDRAAQLLTSARMPLVYGLSQATLEAQAVAVDIAEALRCIIDTPASQFAQQRGTTLQLHGGAHTTWGEAQKFSNLFLSIATVPHISYDKSVSFRCGIEGSKPATVQIAIDEIPIPEQATCNVSTLKASLAEMYLRFDELHAYLSEGADAVEALRNRTKDYRKPDNDTDWDYLFETFEREQYPLMVVDHELWSKHLNLKQVTDLSCIIEQVAIAKSLSGRGAAISTYISDTDNSTGADYVLIARTGASCAVSFATGTAVHSPLDYSSKAALSRKLVDAIVFIGDGPSSHWYKNATRQMQDIDKVFFGPTLPMTLSENDPRLVFIPSPSLNEQSGTTLRRDGVPIPLKPKTASQFPNLECLLKRLLEKVRAKTS